MKRSMTVAVVWVCLSLTGWQGVARAQSDLVIDGFNRRPPVPHKRYAPKPLFAQVGYDVYFDQATVTLKYVTGMPPCAPDDSALAIDFHLPFLYKWGNWLSVRREFDTMLDLSAWCGLEARLKVEIPMGARLRFTLSDAGGLSEGDEMWWYDVESDRLADSSGRWLVVRMPFRNFGKSWGEGSRHNDGRLRLDRIIGLEINILTSSESESSGNVLIDRIAAYK